MDSQKERIATIKKELTDLKNNLHDESIAALSHTASSAVNLYKEIEELATNNHDQFPGITERERIMEFYSIRDSAITILRQSQLLLNQLSPNHKFLKQIKIIEDRIQKNKSMR